LIRIEEGSQERLNMKLKIVLALIPSISAVERLRLFTNEVAEQRPLRGIDIFTNRVAWIAALPNNEVFVEDFSNALPNGAVASTLNVGANDVGLFDIVLTSLAEASTLTDKGFFNTVYQKDVIEVTINNFNGGKVYGFGASWDVENEAGANVDDFKILVDGASVDIGSFQRSGGMQNGIGFVGIVVTGGFEEIVFFTTGADATHLQLSKISVSYTASSPSIIPTTSIVPSLSPSASPSITPTISIVPTTSIVPSMSPSTNAPTLSIGGTFAQFWYDFFTSGTGSEYIFIILGGISTVLSYALLNNAYCCCCH